MKMKNQTPPTIPLFANKSTPKEIKVINPQSSPQSQISINRTYEKHNNHNPPPNNCQILGLQNTDVEKTIENIYYNENKKSSAEGEANFAKLNNHQMGSDHYQPLHSPP